MKCYKFKLLAFDFFMALDKGYLIITSRSLEIDLYLYKNKALIFAFLTKSNLSDVDIDEDLIIIDP